MSGVFLRDLMRGYSKSLLKRLPTSPSHQVGKNVTPVQKKLKKKTGEASQQIVKNVAQVKKKLKKTTGNASPQIGKNVTPVKKKLKKTTGNASPQIGKNVTPVEKKLKKTTRNASPQIGKNVTPVKKKLKKTGEASPFKNAEESKKWKRSKQVKSSPANAVADDGKEDKQVGEIVSPGNKSRKRNLEVAKSNDCSSTSKHMKINIPSYLSVSSASDTNKKKTDIEVFKEQIKRKILIATLLHNKKKKMVDESKTDPKQMVPLIAKERIPERSALNPQRMAPGQKQDVSSTAPVSDTVSLKLMELSKLLCPMKIIIKLTDDASKSTTQTLLSQGNVESHNAVALEARPSPPKAKARKRVATKPVPTSSNDLAVCSPMVVLPQMVISPPESPPHVSSTTPVMSLPPRTTSLVLPNGVIPVWLVPKLENISPPGSFDGDVSATPPLTMVPLVKRMLSLSAPNTPDPAVTVESSACAPVSVPQESSPMHPIEARYKLPRACSLPPSIVRSNVAPGDLRSVTENVREIIASNRKSSRALKSKAAASSRKRSSLMTPRTIRAAERAVNRFSPTMCSKPRLVLRKTLDCRRRSSRQEATSVSTTLQPVSEALPTSERRVNVLSDNVGGKKGKDFKQTKKVLDSNVSTDGQTSTSANSENHEGRDTGITASNEPGSMQNESDVEPQQETDSLCVGSDVAPKRLRSNLRPSTVQSLPGETSRVAAFKAVKQTRLPIAENQGHNKKRKVGFKVRPFIRNKCAPKKKSMEAIALENLASNRNNNIETEAEVVDVLENSNNEIIQNLLDSVSGESRKKRKKSSRSAVANCCWLCGGWEVKLRMHLRLKHADAFVRRKERGLSGDVKSRLVRKRTKQCYDTAIMLRRVQRYPFSKSVLRRRYDEAEWKTCEESVLRSTEALGFKVMSGAGAWRWKAIAGRKEGNYDFFVED